MSLAPAILSSSPSGASVTCSGTNRAATPWPASEAQGRRERERVEVRERGGGRGEGGEMSEALPLVDVRAQCWEGRVRI